MINLLKVIPIILLLLGIGSPLDSAKDGKLKKHATMLYENDPNTLRIEDNKLVGTIYTGLRLKTKEERRITFKEGSGFEGPDVKIEESNGYIRLNLENNRVVYIKPEDAKHWFFDYGYFAGLREGLTINPSKCPFCEDHVEMTDRSFRYHREDNLVFTFESKFFDKPVFLGVSFPTPSYKSGKTYYLLRNKPQLLNSAKEFISRRMEGGTFSDEAAAYIFRFADLVPEDVIYQVLLDDQKTIDDMSKEEYFIYRNAGNSSGYGYGSWKNQNYNHWWRRTSARSVEKNNDILLLIWR